MSDYYGARKRMRNESVAILDIRSNEVTFLLGARGVNGTFVFKGSRSEKFSGYSIEKGFSDVESFQRAVDNAVASVRKNYDGEIREVFVGVPPSEITVLTKGHSNAYPNKRKICLPDIEALYESGLEQLMGTGRCIRRSNMYFTLGDNRKYFTKEDLYGISTTMLKGALSYYFTSVEFYENINNLLKTIGFEQIYLIPSTLAQAVYLFPQRNREGYAFLLDVGYSTSSITVIYGNGIVHEESLNCGIERILLRLKEKFSINDSVAIEMLTSANVSGGILQEGATWTSAQSDTPYLMQEINEEIKYGLDFLCEGISVFFDKRYKEKDALGLGFNPIGITGEGVGYVKGIGEHVSKQLNMLTQIVYPDLPYYDKPMFSSRISLLDMAIADKEKQGFMYKIFNYLGGRRK